MEERLESATGEPGEARLAAVERGDDCEPALGRWGQRFLVFGILLLTLLFVGSVVWLLGMLAYTSPPVPGSG